MEQVPLWVSLTQIGASILLGVSAFVVAVLGLNWSYRNNFGWKPIALITSSGEQWKKGSGDHYAFIHLEVWNRFKYPITIRQMRISTFNLPVRRVLEFAPGGKWYINTNEVRHYGDHVIPPNSLMHNEILIPINVPNYLRTTLGVKIDWFDPRRNKDYIIMFDHAYVIGNEPYTPKAKPKEEVSS